MTNKISIVLVVLITAFSTLDAQTSKQVKQIAYRDSLRLVEIFKDLHQNPEPPFQEVRTAGIVEKELKTLGYEIVTGIGKTGVVGVFRNGTGPTVMYRADMDCNSVKEITGLPYASIKAMQNDEGIEVPVMHACGHDAHVTWMLGVAKIMIDLKTQWKGTLVFVGQPGEEVGLGAKAMAADSIFRKNIPVPDHLFGMHSIPLAVGMIDNAVGERMPGSDQLDVTFHGIGGHGATPELTKDPIVMASEAVLQYQTIISRGIAAQDAAVLTVGAFHAGTNNNVIPSSASLKLNLRWFNEDTRKTLLDGISRINEGIAIANNLPKEKYPVVEMKMTVLPVINNIKLTNKINHALSFIVSPENLITNSRGLMVSEDFPHLVINSRKTDYNYLWVGIANNKLAAKAKLEGKNYPFFNHNGNFQVDLSAIPYGTVIGATALLEIFSD